jgi:hypothetical protein
MSRLLLASVVAVCVASVSFAGEPIKSGPQVGDDLPGPFHPLNVTGENAGEKACLYCRHGSAPVAMVFARDLTPAVAKLVKKLDECTIKNKEKEMGSFAVFCSDAGALRKKLEETAKAEGLKELVLSIDNPAGPKDYNFVKDADVTVVLYVNTTVKANFSFRKGELTDKAIDAILADVPKILKK